MPSRTFPVLPLALVDPRCGLAQGWGTADGYLQGSAARIARWRTARCSARCPKFSSKASSGIELKEHTFSLDNFKSKTHQRATEHLHDKPAYTRCERISPRTHGDIDLFDGAASFQRPHRPRCQVVSTPWHRGEGRPQLR